MIRKCLLMIWAVALISPAADGAVNFEEQSTSVAWNELASLVLGRTVSIGFSGGTEIQGTALAVQDEGLVVNIKKTGNQSYPQGRNTIPRSAISVIEVTEETRGWAKPLLTAAAGAGAALAYFPQAISDSRINVSDSRRVAEWSAVGAGAGVIGYFIGKKISRTVRVLRVSPASSARSGALIYNAP